MANAPTSMDIDALSKAISAAHPQAIVPDSPQDQWLEIVPDQWAAVSQMLHADEALAFDMLMCITGYDEGVEGQLIVIYDLHSMTHLHKIEIRIKVPRSGGEVPSVANIWRAADWHEREAYDMYGMKFSGHPDMRRILLPDDWDSYPLLKDYETPDYYKGIPVPKDKRGWE